MSLYFHAVYMQSIVVSSIIRHISNLLFNCIVQMDTILTKLISMSEIGHKRYDIFQQNIAELLTYLDDRYVLHEKQSNIIV